MFSLRLYLVVLSHACDNKIELDKFVTISNVVFLGSEMRLTNDSSGISTVYITVFISPNLTSRFFGIVLSFSVLAESHG